MKNKIKSLLIELGISDEKSIVPFYPKVRDREDVAVMKCNRSGVIFLSRTDHMNLSHYKDKKNYRYAEGSDRKNAQLASLDDDNRRFEQFKYIICNKKWIDIGTGSGGIMDLLSSVACETVAVEPQENARRCLIESGYRTFLSIEDVVEHDFDVATLFHVLEHLTDPVETLISIRNKMKNDGKVIIEVPHARDFLISFLNLEKFKAFTFWSEHLILHTRQSLEVLLSKAGFSNVVIGGYQRYPLANHLYWLVEGKPGGQIIWDYLRTGELDIAYTNMLSHLDYTDTLIAIAQV